MRREEAVSFASVPSSVSVFMAAAYVGIGQHRSAYVTRQHTPDFEEGGRSVRFASGLRQVVVE